MNTRVWYLNATERPMEFWDFWSALTESSSIMTAFNEIKKSEMTDNEDVDIAEALIACYVYESADKEKRKLDTKPIRLLIQSIGTSKFNPKFSWVQVVQRDCLSILKSEIKPRNPKIYRKCKELTESLV